MSDGAHYYNKQGEPRHGVDLRVARKEDLLISVTTYLDIFEKFGLTKWKISQRMELAFEILKGSPEMGFNDFLAAVQALFDERNNAADIGTKSHDILDLMVTNAVPLDGAKDFFYGHVSKDIEFMWTSIRMAYEWFTKVMVVIGSTEKTVCNIEDRYAGKLDASGIMCSPDMDPKHAMLGILDWKTQDVKRPGQLKNGSGLKAPKVNVYPEWIMQIGAYAKCEKALHGYNAVIGTNPLYPFFRAVHYETKDIIKGYKDFRYCQMVFNSLKKI